MPRKGEILTNYYTRDEDIKRELLEGLQQKKIDAKFQYVEKQQTNTWFDYCEQSGYGYHAEFKELLETMVGYFLSNCETDVSVIALGVGDGLKEKALVQRLQQSRKVTLFFMDFSRFVINVAVKNVCNSDALKETFVADLMNFSDVEDIAEYIKERYKGTNVFTLLGNTLGNYPQTAIFKTLRMAMVPGDKVLIDVNCATAKGHQALKDHSTFTSKEQLLATLSAVGIAATDGTIEVKVDKDELFPQLDVVKQYFCFTCNKVITYRRENIYFAKGERVLMGYANQYTFKMLEHLLPAHGLRMVKHAQEGTYHQLLCELA